MARRRAELCDAGSSVFHEQVVALTLILSLRGREKVRCLPRSYFLTACGQPISPSSPIG